MTEVVDVTSDNQAGAPNYEFEMELVDLADLATEQQVFSLWLSAHL